MNLLTVSGITKSSAGGFILKDINFALQRFQKIAVAGETGSGKSTLLKIIAGLMQAENGEVLFETEKVLGPDDKLIPGHKGIAYLSQHFELRNNYRVEELLEMASKMTGKEAADICDICRITHLLHRRTDQLSGGEKQRIAAACLLVTAPKLLLLDEPYSNLDAIHKTILKSVISDIGERLRITCMLVSHDPLDTLSWADEIIVMKDGQIIQTGNPLQIYRQPVNEYAAGLFGKYNILSLQVAAAFSVFAEKMNGKNIFTRPEDFKIAGDEQEAVIGEVKRADFYGSYFEVEVMIEGSTITVRTDKSSLVKGDLVYVSVSSDKLWNL